MQFIQYQKTWSHGRNHQTKNSHDVEPRKALIHIPLPYDKAVTKQSILAKMEKTTRHFVLVHGAGHGAWCWYKAIPQLKSAGHEVTALDVAASGIYPKQVHELNSITEYVEPLMEFLGSLAEEERVILVGHSMGGICISMAIERFPQKIATAVFVSAFMPAPDLSFVTLVHEDLTLALSLVRPTRLYGDEEAMREGTRVAEENYGAVSKVYIACEQDIVLKHDFQMWMIEQNPTTHVKTITASDHMPMFSKPYTFALAFKGLPKHIINL